MSIPKQMGVGMLLLIVFIIMIIRVYPASSAILERIGIPQSLLAVMIGGDGTVEAQQGSAVRAEGGAGGGGPRAAIVTTAIVAQDEVNGRLESIGSSESLKTVSMVPLTSGVLTEVSVKSGDTVKEGDVLARLNSDAEEIAKEQAEVALKSADEKLKRYQALGAKSVVSKAEIADLQTARDTAALALREAALNLQNRSIIAPIAGVVGIVPVELGDYVTSTTEITMIDDRSRIIVDFWIPERFAGVVAVGQKISARPLAFTDQTFEGKVAALGSRVETDSRTLQVRAEIDNTEDRLRPGMSFAVSMSFKGEPYAAVDPLAVQWDADGSYVWTVADDTATRTAVKIMQRNPDNVLVDGDLVEGAQVIIAGLTGLRDGAAIKILEVAPVTSPSGGVLQTGSAKVVTAPAGEKG